MKRVYKFLLMITCASMATSCLVDDTVDTDGYDQGPNLVGFTSTTAAANFTATGDEYPFSLDMEVVGPTSMTMTDDVTFSVSVDASSTAVADVNYAPLSVTTFTLTEGQNYIDNLPITILTDGITPPLDESPVLVLNITQVTSNGNVVANGITATCAVTINYLCESALAGDYAIYFSSGTNYVTITEVEPGTYHSDYLPTFASWYWFEFSDVCGDLTITDWQYQASNPVTGSDGGAATGTVDSTTGDLNFTNVNCAGVSWYVDLSWTLYRL
ncbi:hypothetical protein NBRC110019_23610 [Neptunitalea chrysea]|uniref:Calx-beta domain-containing protein n=1 Tax=Neptunitalea chrysea TaxID=1647581 RepID=A0A9W6B680_9FLAO|nr:hypothetical protein [Neptunitalea chrysea]GLB53320.1 hypothetical protein NBRC110019_23610 [Neptunitalea chrysea]